MVSNESCGKQARPCLLGALRHFVSASPVTPGEQAEVGKRPVINISNV